MKMATIDLRRTWHPVATTRDLAPRAIYRTSLLGRELVLWRADDGFVNAWENRCLHRGVRLSIGSCDGAELVCRYHGWRYSNRSGGCTYVPAHPADAPARTIRNVSFPTIERYGLIWIGEQSIGDVPDLAALSGPTCGLRSLPIDAPWDTVVAGLADHRFAPSQALDADLDETQTSVSVDGLAVTITSTFGDEASAAVFVVQPLDADRSVVRPVLGESPTQPIDVLRHHAAELARRKRIIEAGDWAKPEGTPTSLETPVTLATVSGPATNDLLPVTVVAKHPTANDIAVFELAAAGRSTLPTFQPGDHLDLHLPNGLVRQYSITNRPGQSDRYRIAVKLDANSRGGSNHLHQSVEVGDVLHISEPRSGFPLRRNVPTTLFVAGGVGVTPLLSMAHALWSMELAFDFHYFAAGSDHIAFADELGRFGDAVHHHLGLSPADTSATLGRLLDRPRVDTQVYACGPPAMLDVLRAMAAEGGWPDDAIRFEYFENTTEIDDSSSFTVELARSAQTLQVPGGSSILQVLREHDVPIVSSCESGACGTCVATVIDGEPLHHDVYLSPRERAAGQLLTCVSRARSDRLVLDL